MSDKSIVILPAKEEYLPAVALFAKQSFRDTFFEAAGYDEEEFLVFIEEEYSLQKLREWMNDSNDYGFVVAMKGDSICVGFSLVGKKCKLPFESVKENIDCEIYKCYIAKEYFGSGIATLLMNTSLEWIAENCKFGDIYIGVWSENYRAQKFYSKFGAEKVGEYDYAVGETKDHEFIFRINRNIKAN